MTATVRNFCDYFGDIKSRDSRMASINHVGHVMSILFARRNFRSLTPLAFDSASRTSSGIPSMRRLSSSAIKFHASSWRASICGSASQVVHCPRARARRCRFRDTARFNVSYLMRRATATSRVARVRSPRSLPIRISARKTSIAIPRIPVNASATLLDGGRPRFRFTAQPLPYRRPSSSTAASLCSGARCA